MDKYDFTNTHGEFSVEVGDKIMMEDEQQFEVDVILEPVSPESGNGFDQVRLMRKTGENSYEVIDKDKIVEVFGNEHTLADEWCRQCGGDLHLDSVEDLTDYFGEDCGHAKVYNLSCPNCGMQFEIREATMTERLDHYNYYHKKENEQ